MRWIILFIHGVIGFIAAYILLLSLQGVEHAWLPNWAMQTIGYAGMAWAGLVVGRMMFVLRKNQQRTRRRAGKYKGPLGY